MGRERDTVLSRQDLRRPVKHALNWRLPRPELQMHKIIACLKEVFPDCDPSVITPQTTLGEVPGWDSMNSVNLLMELESAFSVSMFNETLTSKQRVEDVAELLRGKGVEL